MQEDSSTVNELRITISLLTPPITTSKCQNGEMYSINYMNYSGGQINRFGWIWEKGYGILPTYVVRTFHDLPLLLHRSYCR